MQRLQNLHNSELQVQIALDIDLIGLFGTEQAELEYQYWWGPKFNEDLSSIPYGVTKHNNEHYDNVFTNLCFTEFGWYLQDERQTFECEEVVDQPNILDNKIEYYGCRFVHSMLNPKTNLPNHLDGAIRAYTDEKIINRLNISIDKSERDSWYTKLWRIDNDIPVSLWKELITHYYRDNMLVGEYFSGQDEKFSKIVLEDQAEDEVVSSEKYIPVDMQQGDGIRLYFQQLPDIHIDEKYEITVKSNDFFVHDGLKKRVMESETITVLKLLNKYGVKVRYPVTARVGHEDMIFNFPTFICRNLTIAGKVQQAICELCNIWVENQDDRLISYSIVANLKDVAIKLSFAGHIKDFIEVFGTIGTEFPQRENLYEWLCTLYNKNNEFVAACQHPKVYDILSKSGNLRFPRQIVPNKYLEDIRMENHGLMVSFTERKEIVTEIINNKLGIAPLYLIEKTECSKCKTDYRSCNCVKFIDECVESIQEFKFLGATWTNRHA